jgi:hypothetical protein
VSDLVHNERLKLSANVLNGAAGSSFAVGVIAPAAAAFYNVGAAPGVPLAALSIGAAIWFSAAVALHLAARLILGGLKP